MDKQKEILAAALKLFTSLGFHGTATSQIAKAAGVANGTLFHYFKTKEALIIALYLNIKTNLGQYIESKVLLTDNPGIIIKKMFTNTLFWGLENKTAFQFIQLFHTSPFLNKLTDEEMSRQTQHHHALIKAGIKAKIIKPLPVDFIYTLVSSHTFGVYQYLVSSAFSKPKQKKVIDDAFEMMWDMIT